MVEARKYTVRPYKPARADRKDSFRIYLSATALHHHSLRAGDLCQLSDASHLTFLAIAWPAPEKIQDNIIQTTKTLQSLYGLRLGDQVFLSHTSSSVLQAHDIVVSTSHDAEDRPTSHDLESLEEAHWTCLLRYELKQAGLLCPGMTFANIRSIGKERTFQINTINSSSDIHLCEFRDSSTVVIRAKTDQIVETSSNPEVRRFRLDVSLIGGLDAEINRLNHVLAAYDSSMGEFKIEDKHQLRNRGIILHGPSGTGKSMLLRMVTELPGWRRVFHIQDTICGGRIGTAEVAIHDFFSDARCHQPSIIIIDDIDAIAGKKDLVNNPQSLNVASILCQEFDQHGDCQVLVLAATKQLALVDDSLRRAGRFSTEIELSPPGRDARAEILHLAIGKSKDKGIHQLLQLADRTHGYVGADLAELVQIVMNHAAIRIQALPTCNERNQLINSSGTPPGFAIAVTEQDIEAALSEVRPTAMKGIFLDTPKVRWSQVGGQEEVKKALHKAIEWPLKHRAEMDDVGLLSKKGLLLYGPPGCSKTLIAKAAATEAGVNFIAVKGAEVLSMYVGESERAIREIFRKARGASPTLVFFDEIDAIGDSREHSPHGGLHMLTTLLNELDGIEVLHGVFILAATNRPEVLDRALLRPGRIEGAIYVGLPDYDTRLEVAVIETRKMKVGADVDVANLAHETDGYSGAEIVSVFQQAGYAALEDHIQHGARLVISRKHFEQALDEVPKQVTPEMVHKYETWGRLSKGNGQGSRSSELSQSSA